MRLKLPIKIVVSAMLTALGEEEVCWRRTLAMTKST